MNCGVRRDLYAELLVQLSGEGFQFRLTSLNVSARQVPETWICAPGPTPMDEQDFAVSNQSARHHRTHTGITPAPSDKPLP